MNMWNDFDGITEIILSQMGIFGLEFLPSKIKTLKNHFCNKYLDKAYPAPLNCHKSASEIFALFQEKNK